MNTLPAAIVLISLFVLAIMIVGTSLGDYPHGAAIERLPVHKVKLIAIDPDTEYERLAAMNDKLWTDAESIAKREKAIEEAERLLVSCGAAGVIMAVFFDAGEYMHMVAAEAGTVPNPPGPPGELWRQVASNVDHVAEESEGWVQ